jgi:hypothetical protein
MGFFLTVVNGCFCRGFCENVVADRGFLMVNFWWVAGERWLENDLNSATKNTPRFSDLFLGFPVLGRSGVGDWLRFGGCFLSDDLVVWAGGGQVAAVEVDCVGAEAALEGCWENVLALAES